MSQSPCLGEQWIEEVTEVDFVRTIPKGRPEGEHLEFKAQIRGWKAETRERRYQNWLGKTEHNLRKALLSAPWKERVKDVLLVPQAWYPEHTPKYETKGWWYVPAEAVLGRMWKSCNTFCELPDFTVISGFVTNTLAKTGIGTGIDQQPGDVWRELVSLHQR